MNFDRKKILVVGSLAYDNLMECKGFFKDLFIAEDPNMAITAQNRTVSFGGCGGNIAYTLSLFGEAAALMTSVGQDFTEYKNWLVKQKIDTAGIYESPEKLTASAFIVTDPRENQIALFDAGAMNEFPEIQNLKAFGEDLKEVGFAIIAPDNPERMVRIAAECFEAGIPYLFDPAQQITHIDPEKLLVTVRNAKMVIVNEHENELLLAQLGMSHEELLQIVPTFIQTRGAEGCVVFSKDSDAIKSSEQKFTVSAVAPTNAIDPTGCGDAFRAGVVAGLLRGFDLQKSCQMGALSATYNLEHKGTQKHSFTLQDFALRFEKSFGVPF